MLTAIYVACLFFGINVMTMRAMNIRHEDGPALSLKKAIWFNFCLALTIFASIGLIVQAFNLGRNLF